MAGREVPFGAVGIDRLRLDHKLGKGGYGEAWKATDPATGTSYCYKFIHVVQADTPEKQAELAARVRNEASVNIDSPYIIPALGYKQYTPRKFGVLFEFFDNAISLNEWLHAHHASAPWSRKRAILEQALRGLAAAHRHNIVHRDIKPGNILINDREEVRVIDFGIGKFKHGLDGASGGPTVPGARLGTIPYMAPELWVDSSKADSRCDVYAFGHVVYETIVGHNAWIAHGWIEITKPNKINEACAWFLDYSKRHTHLIDTDRFRFPEAPVVQTLLERALCFDLDTRYCNADAILDAWFGTDALRTLPLSNPTRLTLVVLEGPTKGNLIPVPLQPGKTITLGRKQIDTNNPYLSRKHAEIRFEDGKLYIRDAGSTNGTIINGRLLAPGEKQPLQHDQRIRLADTFLQVQLT